MYLRASISLFITTFVMVSANHPPAGAQCQLHQVAVVANVNAKGGKTPLWRRSDELEESILFVVGLHTNTDGARHSYSVKDPWGERDAFNNLCNAMHGQCKDLSSKQARLARMALVLSAAQAGWPSDQLAKTRLSENVIVMKNAKPCPLIDGEFLISATALHKPHMRDVCAIENYADSSVIPAIVIPGGTSELTSRGVGVGDIVAVLRPGGSKPIFGVIADTGDQNKLGEGSMAMNQLLLNRHPPKNYEEIKEGWDVPIAYVMVFPSSRNSADPYMDPRRISEIGAKLLGESSIDLERCGSAYAQAAAK